VPDEITREKVVGSIPTGGSETPSLTCIYAGFSVRRPELHGGRVTSGSPVGHQWVTSGSPVSHRC